MKSIPIYLTLFITLVTGYGVATDETANKTNSQWKSGQPALTPSSTDAEEDKSIEDDKTLQRNTPATKTDAPPYRASSNDGKVSHFASNVPIPIVSPKLISPKARVRTNFESGSFDQPAAKPAHTQTADTKHDKK